MQLCLVELFISYELLLVHLSFCFVNEGNDGLEVIHNNNNFDLILVDLAIPEFSGLDVIKSLKKKNLLEQKKNVDFKASSNPRVMEDIRNSRVKGILKKPCSVDDLSILIDKFRTND